MSPKTRLIGIVLPCTGFDKKKTNIWIFVLLISQLLYIGSLEFLCLPHITRGILWGVGTRMLKILSIEAKIWAKRKFQCEIILSTPFTLPLIATGTAFLCNSNAEWGTKEIYIQSYFTCQNLALWTLRETAYYPSQSQNRWFNKILLLF